MTALDAWQRLSNVECVEWVLGEVWYGVSGARFHLWIQGQAERDFDGPRYVGALGRVVETVDPEIGALVRWTAERGRRVRAGEGGEALFSIVPLVWEPVLERASRVLVEVVERWPDSLELAELKAGEPPIRKAPEPSDSGCRYPGCAVGFTEAATDRCAVRAEGPEMAVQAALFALWRHGVSDDELETLNDEAGRSDIPLAQTLSAWVDFDGTGAPPTEDTLAAFAQSLDPIAAVLGIESSATPTLHRIKTERLDELTAALTPHGGLRVRPDAEAHFLLRMRSAPPALLVDSRDIGTEEEASLVVQAIWSGHIVVMAGNAHGARWVLELIEANRPG